MDGTRVGQDAMNNCTDQEYWDTLVSQCIPCSLVCSQSPARRCDAVCESMDCNKRPGFYYDDLVKNCIKCSLVCGQHPKECALSCEPTPPGPAAVLEQKACAEQDPWLVLYLLLGLCLCSLICSLLLGWTHLRRKGEGVSCQAGAGSCQCREDPAKDGLVEAGSVADGFTAIRIPEPVETCGFCFPGHGSAVQETKPCHSSSCHPGERAVPSFSGICSSGSAGPGPALTRATSKSSVLPPKRRPPRCDHSGCSSTGSEQRDAPSAPKSKLLHSLLPKTGRASTQPRLCQGLEDTDRAGGCTELFASTQETKFPLFLCTPSERRHFPCSSI